jgi:hypothetical protein
LVIVNAVYPRVYPIPIMSAVHGMSDRISALSTVLKGIFLKPEKIVVKRCTPSIKNLETQIDQKGFVSNLGKNFTIRSSIF